MTCPYAIAPGGGRSDDEDSSTAISTPLSGPSLPTIDDPEILEALSLAKSACPAFQGKNGDCPFRDATDADSMRKAMLRVPPSHISAINGSDGRSSPTSSVDDSVDGAGPSTSYRFRKALEHVHKMSVALHDTNSAAQEGSDGGDGATVPSNFLLDGGCPFKTFYQGKKGKELFATAMEDFSLGAILAKMAGDHEEMHQKEEQQPEEEEEGKKGKDKSEILAADVMAAAVVAAAMPASAAEKEHAPEEEENEDPHISISKALQTGTAESHEAAESVHFVKNFVKGIIDRELFGTLTVSLYHVYRVLEEELDQHGPRHFPSLHYPAELNRTECLEDDAEFFHGLGWEETAMGRTPSPATADYLDRIRFVAATEPLLLLSHAYTRYLGDLSGGRILARIASRALNLKGSDDGLRFYEFEKIPNAKKFKDVYRRALDNLELSRGQVDRLVAEANVAFVLNMRVFEELDVQSGVKGASIRPIEEATKYYDRVIEEQRTGRRRSNSQSAGEEKCPFGFLGGPNPHAEKAATAAASKEDAVTTAPSHGAHKEGARCPWPFVFFHDAGQGMRDWQTWVVIALVSHWLISMISS